MVCWSLLLSSNMHFVRGHKFHFPDFKFCQVWHFFWVVPTRHYIGVLLYVVHNSGFFCLTERLSLIGIYWLTMRNLWSCWDNSVTSQFLLLVISQHYVAHTVNGSLSFVQYSTGQETISSYIPAWPSWR